VSRIVAFIVKNISTIILFARLVGWLENTSVLMCIRVHPYSHARYEGHCPWHTVYNGQEKDQRKTNRLRFKHCSTLMKVSIVTNATVRELRKCLRIKLS